MAPIFSSNGVHEFSRLAEPIPPIRSIVFIDRVIWMGRFTGDNQEGVCPKSASGWGRMPNVT